LPFVSVEPPTSGTLKFVGESNDQYAATSVRVEPAGGAADTCDTTDTRDPNDSATATAVKSLKQFVNEIFSMGFSHRKFQ
jgi:hypothetical protein